MPLSISVIPWAILAGSMAIHAGLSFYKALAMSGIVFAGAAQLVSLSMVMEGASLLTIYVTIFFLTAQHFIYALTLEMTFLFYLSQKTNFRVSAYRRIICSKCS